MIKIIDEVYMTINAETESEWTYQFSSQVFKEQCGFFKAPKVFNENEKVMNFVGAAQYMFVFEKDGHKGIFIALLKNDLFEPGKEKEYEEHISCMRNKILNDEATKDAIKIV